MRRPRMLVTGCAFAFVFAVAGGLVGQVARDEKIARVEHGLLPQVVSRGLVGKRLSMAERMAHHGIPGMSMAVIEDGRIAWARAYGVRQRDGISPVTPETLFQAASLSKSVSALGALVLVQQRRVDLDGDVRQWLRSWKPEQTISLRQLLSHTAGLTVSGFSGTSEPRAYRPSHKFSTVTFRQTAVRFGSPPHLERRSAIPGADTWSFSS